MILLPRRFPTRICSLYGQGGKDWLTNLPALRESLLERWALENAQPVPGFSYNYLEFAESPQYGQVVLKIGYPAPELTTEIKVLEYYRGSASAVRLLDYDPDGGALLLERIMPGHHLTVLADHDQATRIAGNSMLALRQPRPEESEFPTIKQWCQAFTRYQEKTKESAGPLPGPLFNHAFDLVKELLRSKENHYLLHGDLHHTNLLSREDGTWAAIDPKGVIGEFAFEVGPYLFNPVPDLIQYPDLKGFLQRRLRILAEITGLDKHRLANWSFCRAVLAGIWSVEEGEEHLTYWVKIARAVRKLIE